MIEGVAILAAPYRNRDLEVGDLVEIEAYFPEKIGATDDLWSIDCNGGTAWTQVGSLTISCQPASIVASESNSLRIVFKGMIHSMGNIGPTEWTVKSDKTKSTYKVVFALNEKQSKLSATQEEIQSTPWLMPVKQFGGWNWPLILICALVFLSAVGLLMNRLWPQLARRLVRQIDHKTATLKKLQTLQKFARSKTSLKQEEWKKFSFELAGTLRQYIDTNFSKDTRDLTDRELIEELRLLVKNKEPTKELEKILGVIDEVRYGRKALDATIVPGLLLDSRRFVEMTFLAKEKS